jgi:hypothetical protein
LRKIQRAAERAGQEQTARRLVTVHSLTATAAAIGTVIVPLVGTILGGGLGLIISIFVSQWILDTDNKRVFAEILAMKDETGLRYAQFLYQRYKCALAFDGLVGLMSMPWQDHVQ